MKNLIFSCINSRIEDNNNIYGCFKLGPFVQGQGLTVANTLRRLLISDLEGLSIVFIKIEGVKHEYSILKGVQESVLEILSNLKQIQFKTDHSVYKPHIAYLNLKGPKVAYAGDMQLPPKIKCIDPSQYIATIAADGELKIKLFICKGRRFYLQESLKYIIEKQYHKILKQRSINYLFLDSIFFPIEQVNFTIEKNTKINKEFIIFEIWTKGGIDPKEALLKAINEIIKILIPFRQFYSFPKLTKVRMNKKHIQTVKPLIKNSNLNNFSSKINSLKFQKKLSSLDINNLNLSLKTYIFLKKSNINTIQDLLEKSKTELRSLKGSTKNIINEMESNLHKLGLKLQN